MTLTALARELGLTYQQVQKYETGRNRISASTLFRTANRLGFDLAFFFSGCAAVADGRTAPVELPPGDDDELRAALGRVQDEEIRAKLTALMETLELRSRVLPRT